MFTVVYLDSMKYDHLKQEMWVAATVTNHFWVLFHPICKTYEILENVTNKNKKCANYNLCFMWNIYVY